MLATEEERLNYHTENMAFWARSYGLPVNHVLSDRYFIDGFGSKGRHHAYKGGLLVHTGEVFEYCRKVHAGSIDDRRVLLTAAVWHDYAKIYDYDEAGGKTPYRDLIRHVAGSFHEWMKHSEGQPEHFRQSVGHCILAHHGRQEWGSPVEPQTEEALILHQADYWSSCWGSGR